MKGLRLLSYLTLCWSHYVVLTAIKDSDERSFYEIESRQADWDVCELQRQIITRPEDLLNEPFVLNGVPLL